MSYSIRIFGKKADVLAILNDVNDQRANYAPASVRQFAAAAITTIPDQQAGRNPWEAADYVLVEASGHEPGQHNIKVLGQRNDVPLPPPVAQAVAAAPDAQAATPAPAPDASAADGAGSAPA